MSENIKFGQERICYVNFAGHLQNAYNPNMLYPGLPNRWSDNDWRDFIDMVADFGYTAFEFWLVPRLFCREAMSSEFGREFIRSMNMIIEYAHTRNLKVAVLCSLATTGSDWMTLCPNLADEWKEIQYLWDAWTKALPGLDIISIFPGDPGACSRNGCTPETYIDRSIDIGHLVRKNLPEVKIELGTWGPPFFGWGNLRGPEGWRGEFVQEYQHTAWTFDIERTKRSMNHLLRRLDDFPQPFTVALNLGFNPDGIPEGEQDARGWAREIAKTHNIRTWDFSLTEGENNVIPHYRFNRLFEQRRRERAAAPYSGGICFTMTPLLNQLSLWESAQSFINPDANPEELAGDFFERLFGSEGRGIVPYLPLFEVVKDWGNHNDIDPAAPEYHSRMLELRDLLADLKQSVNDACSFHPSPETYRGELLFFAQLFADLSGQSPDFDALAERYWRRIYGIYDHLGEHVDPRPHHATRSLINAFRGEGDASEVVFGKWS